MNKVLVGADPELFFCNSRGSLVSVIGKLPGDKHNTHYIDQDGNGILVDNVAAEFNTAPADSAEAFINSVAKNLIELDERAAKLGLQLAAHVASASFPPEEMQDPEAWVFGCEPDFNAWDGGEANPKPAAEDEFLRSCGGHVHVGSGDLDKLAIVKAMDLFLGVPSLLMDPDQDRRKLYGKGGCFRPKPYGVEYRTLSNFWIWSTKSILWVYEQTQKAVEFVASGKNIPEDVADLIRKAINDSDMDAAGKVFDLFPEVIPPKELMAA